MALTLVATAGASTANTYVTLDDAEDIVLEYLSHITSGWSAATDDNKNIALVQATKDIDSLGFHGSKYYTEWDESDDDYQALQFPRAEDTTDEDSLYIPAKVEHATVLQACYLLRSGAAAQVSSDAITSGIVSRGTGRYSETISSHQFRKVCPEASALLRKWLRTTVRIERG